LVLQEIENSVRCDRNQRLPSTSLSDASAARLSHCARSTAMLQLHSFLVLRMARLRDCDVPQSVHRPESLPCTEPDVRSRLFALLITSEPAATIVF
jgi:hypothetical protein